MGVAGAGKTTVGRLLASDLGCDFYDADDVHSPDSMAKMARGEGLTDADRDPWLTALRGMVDRALAGGACAVLACSALTESHRHTLGAHRPGVSLVYLRTPRDVLAERLRERRGHFAGDVLLPSQLATLEEPAHAIVVDGSRPPALLVAAIRQALVS